MGGALVRRLAIAAVLLLLLVLPPTRAIVMDGISWLGEAVGVITGDHLDDIDAGSSGGR